MRGIECRAYSLHSRSSYGSHSSATGPLWFDCFRVNNTSIMGRRLSGPSARTRDAQPLPISTQHNSPTSNDRNSVSQHDELIHFVGGSWNVIYQEYQNGSQGSNGRFHIQFYEEGHSDKLKGFKPFDLEAWWGKQTIQRYQQRS